MNASKDHLCGQWAVSVLLENFLAVVVGVSDLSWPKPGASLNVGKGEVRGKRKGSRDSH